MRAFYARQDARDAGARQPRRERASRWRSTSPCSRARRARAGARPLARLRRRGARCWRLAAGAADRGPRAGARRCVEEPRRWRPAAVAALAMAAGAAAVAALVEHRATLRALAAARRRRAGRRGRVPGAARAAARRGPGAAARGCCPGRDERALRTPASIRRSRRGALGRTRAPAFPSPNRASRLTHLGRGAVWLALAALGAGRRAARSRCPPTTAARRSRPRIWPALEIVFYRVDARAAGRRATTCAAVAARARRHLPDLALRLSRCRRRPPERGRSRTPRTGCSRSTATGRPLGSRGDAAIFCPRKSLGVPDGGALLVRATAERRPLGEPRTAAAGRWPRSTAALAPGRAALRGSAGAARGRGGGDRSASSRARRRRSTRER